MSEKILNQILIELTTMNKRLDNLEGRFDSLEERFNTFEGRFDTFEKRLSNLESDVQTIKKQIEEFPAMKGAILETNATVKRIEEVQENHEMTLTYLSRKYVDQQMKIQALSALRT